MAEATIDRYAIYSSSSHRHRERTMVKGKPVVTSDGRRQAALLEQANEGLDDGALLGRFKGFGEKQVARGLVGNRQGVTIAAIAEPELPLEVGAPQIIGRDRQ